VYVFNSIITVSQEKRQKKKKKKKKKKRNKVYLPLNNSNSTAVSSIHQSLSK